MQVSARQAVVETLERVFARHGAVPMDSNTVGFCPVDAPADTADLLSTTGARLAMRCCSHALCLLEDLQLPVPAPVTFHQGVPRCLMQSVSFLSAGISHWQCPCLMCQAVCAGMS